VAAVWRQMLCGDVAQWWQRGGEWWRDVVVSVRGAQYGGEGWRGRVAVKGDCSELGCWGQPTQTHTNNHTNNQPCSQPARRLTKLIISKPIVLTTGLFATQTSNHPSANEQCNAASQQTSKPAN
jgi:hypothetical protein